MPSLPLASGAAAPGPPLPCAAQAHAATAPARADAAPEAGQETLLIIRDDDAAPGAAAVSATTLAAEPEAAGGDGGRAARAGLPCSGSGGHRAEVSESGAVSWSGDEGGQGSEQQGRATRTPTAAGEGEGEGAVSESGSDKSGGDGVMKECARPECGAAQDAVGPARGGQGKGGECVVLEVRLATTGRSPAAAVLRVEAALSDSIAHVRRLLHAAAGEAGDSTAGEWRGALGRGLVGFGGRPLREGDRVGDVARVVSTATQARWLSRARPVPLQILDAPEVSAIVDVPEMPGSQAGVSGGDAAGQGPVSSSAAAAAATDAPDAFDQSAAARMTEGGTGGRETVSGLAAAVAQPPLQPAQPSLAETKGSSSVTVAGLARLGDGACCAEVPSKCGAAAREELEEAEEEDSSGEMALLVVKEPMGCSEDVWLELPLSASVARLARLWIAARRPALPLPAHTAPPPPLSSVRLVAGGRGLSGSERLSGLLCSRGAGGAGEKALVVYAYVRPAGG